MSKQLPKSNPSNRLVNPDPHSAPPAVSESEKQTQGSVFGLVGLEPILEIVKTLLWTGQVAGERPASAIICAPIGSGKTSVLEKIQCDTAQFFSDFTSSNAREILRNEKLSHIMIGDLLSVLGHKSGTVKLSLNILGKMTGDRVNTDPWTNEPIKSRRIGLITAIPPGELFSPKLKSILWDSGFLSRCIVIQYDYTKSTIEKIHRFIKSDAYTRMRPYEFEIECGEVEVSIPPDISEKIEILARSIKNDAIGARAHHHLRALIKARARMRKSNVAIGQDYEIVDRISAFMVQGGRQI